MDPNYIVKHDDYGICLDWEDDNEDIVHNVAPKIIYGQYGIVSKNNSFYLLTLDDHEIWSTVISLLNLERAALALGLIELKRNLECQNPESKKRLRNYKFIGEIPKIKSKYFGFNFRFAKRRLLSIRVFLGVQGFTIFPDDLGDIINCLFLKGLLEK
jgi:hypothetical protein